MTSLRHEKSELDRIIELFRFCINKLKEALCFGITTYKEIMNNDNIV